MTADNPPTNDRTQQLRQKLFRAACLMLGVDDEDHEETGTAIVFTDAVMALVAAEQQSLLDRIAQSVKQHTVPEGIDLVTRSYVLNTLEFERSSLKAELGGKG